MSLSSETFRSCVTDTPIEFEKKPKLYVLTAVDMRLPRGWSSPKVQSWVERAQSQQLRMYTMLHGVHRSDCGLSARMRLHAEFAQRHGTTQIIRVQGITHDVGLLAEACARGWAWYSEERSAERGSAAQAGHAGGDA